MPTFSKPGPYDNSVPDDDISERWAREFTADHLNEDAPAISAHMLYNFKDRSEEVWIHVYAAARLITWTYSAHNSYSGSVSYEKLEPTEALSDKFALYINTMERVGWTHYRPAGARREG